MADFTKLNENIAALSAAVDAKLAAPVLDDQPAVDAAAEAVAAITAKLVVPTT